MLQRDEFQVRQHMLLEDYEIYHYLDNSELHVSLHFHDFYECYYLLSGRLSYQIDNHAYTVTPGDLLLIGPNQLHRPLISDAKLPYERIVLWISRRFVERLSTEETDLSRCFSSDQYNLSRLAKLRRAAIEQRLYALLEATNGEG
ncbi:MAG TPA: AraC family ligand binding domain-containing protein, partial [Clostridia bacterium]|nr:AraC family ligand binding domain-containing protein [Clostridia bacterium]